MNMSFDPERLTAPDISRSFTTDGEWKLDELQRFEELDLVNQFGYGYQCIGFVIGVSRNPEYYLLNALLPCFALGFMAQLVFLIPPASGERVRKLCFYALKKQINFLSH